VAIIYTGWLWLDPVVSLVISAVIVIGTWSLLRDSIRLSLDAVPDGIDLAKVRAYLAGLRGVAQVHDLHVWAMSTSETALTVHLVMPGGHPGDDFIAETCRDLQQEFRISHATMQIEIDPNHNCSLAPDHIV
jgi:cobalt-zinc-cadmium efflux system protein